LLFHFQDEIALEYIGWYKKFLRAEVYNYALYHGNDPFMKGALLMGAFEKQIFLSEEVITKMLVSL
jgi:hypothetical protein